MIKGLYTSASSMLTNQHRLDIISNNLSNVNTTGFKKDRGVSRSFPEMLISRIEKGQVDNIGNLGTGVSLDGTYTDYSRGHLKHTGNSLDLAIEGRGFFVVETPQGVRYTRDGNFTVNQAGQIITKDGDPVMGERGPLQIIDGRDVKVDSDGQLHLGDLRGDRVLVVDFPDQNSLEKIGNNLYINNGDEEVEAGDYQLKQGYLENSNVNIVREMVNMIEVNRLYEANQKVISTVDNTLDKAVNSIGRLR